MSAVAPAPVCRPIVIATRESRLALWQAHHVQRLLQAQGYTVSILGMTTRGDQILDRSLSKVGGKGLFVKELELALQNGQADLAVHSLKDVPMELPQGFTLAAVLPREQADDAWVSNRYPRFSDLPAGACVGTSSLRRSVLLRAARPDLRIEPLRGNLDTRLRKLDEGQYDGIVLASAGLLRLELASRIAERFAVSSLLPAAGQGALGIEIRSDRTDVQQALQTLVHQPTWLAVTAERAVSRALGGSCSMPLAAHAIWQDQQLWLRAAWGEEGEAGAAARVLHAQARLPVQQLPEAESLGVQVAQALMAQGAQPAPASD